MHRSETSRDSSRETPGRWHAGRLSRRTVLRAAGASVALPPPLDEHLGLEQRVERFPLTCRPGSGTRVEITAPLA